MAHLIYPLLDSLDDLGVDTSEVRNLPLGKIAAQRNGQLYYHWRSSCPVRQKRLDDTITLSELTTENLCKACEPKPTLLQYNPLPTQLSKYAAAAQHVVDVANRTKRYEAMCNSQVSFQEAAPMWSWGKIFLTQNNHMLPLGSEPNPVDILAHDLLMWLQESYTPRVENIVSVLQYAHPTLADPKYHTRRSIVHYANKRSRMPAVTQQTCPELWAEFKDQPHVLREIAGRIKTAGLKTYLHNTDHLPAPIAALERTYPQLAQHRGHLQEYAQSCLQTLQHFEDAASDTPQLLEVTLKGHKPTPELASLWDHVVTHLEGSVYLVALPEVLMRQNLKDYWFTQHGGEKGNWGPALSSDTPQTYQLALKFLRSSNRRPTNADRQAILAAVRGSQL